MEWNYENPYTNYWKKVRKAIEAEDLRRENEKEITQEYIEEGIRQAEIHANFTVL